MTQALNSLQRMMVNVSRLNLEEIGGSKEIHSAEKNRRVVLGGRRTDHALNHQINKKDVYL